MPTYSTKHGDKKVLSSDQIWLCTTCYKCIEECPQKVKLTDVLFAVRNLAVKKGYLSPSLRQKLDMLTSKGRLAPVTERTSKERKKLGLPPVPKVGVKELR